LRRADDVADRERHYDKPRLQRGVAQPDLPGWDYWMFQSTHVGARSTAIRGETDEQSITNHHRCRLSRRQ
jgi:hypothetical protein